MHDLTTPPYLSASLYNMMARSRNKKDHKSSRGIYDTTLCSVEDIEKTLLHIHIDV